MTVAHQDMPPSTFPVPEGITTLTVDYKSGLLPDSLTPEKYLVQEKFNSAYIPTEVSNVWVQVPVCVDTGQLLTNNCPNSITGVFSEKAYPLDRKYCTGRCRGRSAKRLLYTTRR